MAGGTVRDPVREVIRANAYVPSPVLSALSSVKVGAVRAAGHREEKLATVS